MKYINTKILKIEYKFIQLKMDLVQCFKNNVYLWGNGNKSNREILNITHLQKRIIKIIMGYT